jgi:hypothetical protein
MKDLPISTARWTFTGHQVLGRPIKHAHQGEHKVPMQVVATLGCCENGTYRHYTQAHREEHGRMIEAAPDLYQACFDLMQFEDEMRGVLERFSDLRRFWDAARAALAKADGKPGAPRTRESAEPPDDKLVVRVFMEGGLVQAVEGVPAGVIVRTIDLDTLGSDRAQELSADDMPPWTNDDERSNGRRSVEACVHDWTAVE